MRTARPASATRGLVSCASLALLSTLPACRGAPPEEQEECAALPRPDGGLLVRYPRAVLVDGALDDPAWLDERTAWTPLTRTAASPADARPLAADFAVVADGSRLFVGVRVVGQAAAAALGAPWCVDAVELSFDLGFERNADPETSCTGRGLYDCNDGKLLIPVLRPMSPAALPYTPLNGAQLSFAAASRTESGYSLEAAIDLLLPKTGAVTLGRSIGLDVAVRAPSASCDVTELRWSRAGGGAGRPAYPATFGAATFCPLSRSDTTSLATVSALPRANAPPTAEARLLSGARDLAQGASVSLDVVTEDPDGRVVFVELYRRETIGFTRLARDAHPPFAFLWTAPHDAPDSELLAVATDALGARGLSQRLVVTHPAPAALPRHRVLVLTDELFAGDALRDGVRRTLWRELSPRAPSVTFVGPLGSREAAVIPNPDFPVRSGVSAPQLTLDEARRVLGMSFEDPLERPTAAVIALGAEDLRAGRTPQEVASALRALVQATRTSAPTIELLVLTLAQRAGISLNRLRDTNSVLRAELPSLSTDSSPLTLLDLGQVYFLGAHTADERVPNAAGEALISSLLLTPLVAHGQSPPPPRLEPFGGAHEGDVEVELSHELAGAAIVFTTLAGATPDVPYQGPIRIAPGAGPVTLSAQAIAPDGARSRIVRATYELASDLTPPALVGALAIDPRSLLLIFSEPIVTDALAVLVDGVAAEDVRGGPDARLATLMLAVPLSAGTHQLFISGARDEASPPNVAAPSQGTFEAAAPRGLLAQFFDDTSLDREVARRVEPRVALLFDAQHPVPGRPCRERGQEPRCPDLFGVRLSSFFVPQQSGPHVFRLSGEGLLSVEVDGVRASGAADAELRRELEAGRPARLTVELRYARERFEAPAGQLPDEPERPPRVVLGLLTPGASAPTPIPDDQLLLPP